MRQFASITADILARKGEARPWDHSGSGDAKRSLSWESPPKIRGNNPQGNSQNAAQAIPQSVTQAVSQNASQSVAMPAPEPPIAKLQDLLAEQIEEIHQMLAERNKPRGRHARAQPIPPPPKINPAAAEPTPAKLQWALTEEIAPELHPPAVAADAAPEAAPARSGMDLGEPHDHHADHHDAHHADTHAPDDLRKCTVKISHHDYERLGILAVKQGKSRQRLLQETVNALFTGMTQQFGNSCQCLGKCG
jgi:hypothetical protein